MQPHSRYRNRLLLLTTAILFSTGGAAFKASTLTGWQVACFRSAIAAIFLLIALPESRRGWQLRVVPAAIAYAAALITFVLANRLTTAANAIFLQSSAPLYLLILGPLLLREPVRRADLLYMVAIAAGMAACFVGSSQAAVTAPDPPRGNAIAAASGLCYALLLAGLRWLGRHGTHNPALATVALGNVLAAFATLPMALPVADRGATDVAVILYLGIVQVGLGYACLATAIRQVPALESTTLLMVEPAMSPVWTWLVHAEQPGTWPLAGGAVIVLATLANTWWRSRSESRAKIAAS